MESFLHSNPDPQSLMSTSVDIETMRISIAMLEIYYACLYYFDYLHQLLDMGITPK